MRNYLIGGVPRAGKSLLARRLCRARELSQLPVDALISTLANTFPETAITHYGEKHADTCERLEPFLRELVHQLDYEAIRFVLDLYHVTPRAAAEITSEFDYTVIFLGYPSVDASEKLAAIRRHARPQDWSETLAEHQLLPLVDRFISESRELELECERLGLPFVDTGDNLEDSLDRALDILGGPGN